MNLLFNGGCYLLFSAMAFHNKPSLVPLLDGEKQPLIIRQRRPLKGTTLGSITNEDGNFEIVYFKWRQYLIFFQP